MSALLLTHGSWISSMSMRRKVGYVLIADAYMPFQGTRWAKHGVQPWQKHHFLAKEFMRKINKKWTYSSILDRFQNDEVFHASQLQHNWTKEWCKYFDYIRTIDISHKAPPEQLERYDTLYHFRYHPQQMETSPMKSRPDYHETTRAIVSMNTEKQVKINDTKQLPWGSGPRKGRLACMALTQLEMVLRGEPNIRFKFHTKASSRIRRRACLGKPRSINSYIWWVLESQLVDQVVVGEIKVDMEWRSLNFFLTEVSQPRSGNCCVCDGWCTHSVSHAHFLWHSFFAWRTHIAYTHGSRCLQCACHISPSHPLYSHVSSAVRAVPAWPLRDHMPVCTVFVELYPTRKRGSSALPHERRGVWLPGRSHALHSLRAQGVRQSHLTIRTTIASLTSRKPHARALDCSGGSHSV